MSAFARIAGGHLPRRDRLPVLVALFTVTGLAWLYLVLSAAHVNMASAVHSGMAMTQSWNGVRFVLTFLMWAVMMAAMMIPSATPAILTYAAVVVRIAPTQSRLVSTGLFVGAYLLVWVGFSLGATLLQWGLDSVALLSPSIASSSGLLAGGFLVLAGLYQWAPLKDFCLRHCQTPLSFLASHWKPGPGGALRLGIRHGLYCVGCCWALMLLLFIGGVMNLLWVAALSAFVLLEKLLEAGTRGWRLLSGAVLVITGLLAFGEAVVG